MRFVIARDAGDEQSHFSGSRLVADVVTPLPAGARHLELHLIYVCSIDLAAEQRVEVGCALGALDLDQARPYRPSPSGEAPAISIVG